jgi:SPP1 family predicted phage head-tail adaptor
VERDQPTPDATAGSGTGVIGALRHLIAIETPTRVYDNEGGYTEAWAELGTEWAAIEPATPARLERMVASTVQAVASHIVTMHYRDGVTTKARVKFGTRLFAIRGVQNPEERNIWLLLACEEVVS